MYKLTAKNTATFCALSLVFLSQFVPTTYVPIKSALLLLCGATLSILLASGRIKFSQSQVLGIIVLSVVGLVYSAYGLVRDNPGAIRVLTVVFAWPMVYLFISLALQQPGAIRNFTRFLIATLFAVVVYGWMYLGNVFGIVPDYLYFELDQGQKIGLYEGFVEFNLYSIASLLFLIPVYVHFMFEQYKRGEGLFTLKNIFLICAALLLAVMTGRRAMLLVLLLLPAVIYFSNLILHNKLMFKLRVSFVFSSSIFVGICVILAIWAGLEFTAILDMFIEGFDFSSADGSASERTLQFHALIDGWLNSNVLFGTGNGAAAAISRSDEFPWAYELSYVYLLFSTGIVGVIFYFGWYGWGIYMLRQAMRSRPDLIVYVAPLLTGSVCLCIAAATNPYMGKFDYLWIVLLPFFLAGAIRYQAVEE